MIKKATGSRVKRAWFSDFQYLSFSLFFCLLIFIQLFWLNHFGLWFRSEPMKKYTSIFWNLSENIKTKLTMQSRIRRCISNSILYKVPIFFYTCYFIFLIANWLKWGPVEELLWYVVHIKLWMRFKGVFITCILFYINSLLFYVYFDNFWSSKIYIIKNQTFIFQTRHHLYISNIEMSRSIFCLKVCFYFSL